MPNFSRNLKALRVEAGHSQRLLARLAGIPQQYVSLYERGLAPLPAHVAALARALGVAEDALLVDPPTVRETLELLAARAASGEGRS